MALLFMDGFDKFGAANSNSTVVAGLLTAGEWTTATGTGLSIVAGLSATGYAVSNGGAIHTLSKTLAGSYGRLIGGVRFSSTLALATGVQFTDAGTNQCGITLNTTGTFSVRNGSYSSGTVLGTSTVTITAGTTHYLEWDISFGNANSFTLFLDGVAILGPLTGDTTATANNTSNGFMFTGGSGSSWTLDDFYLFDTTGSTNNAVLLTSPRIETQFPSADAAVQFAVGAAILGTSVSRVGSNTTTAANQLRVRAFTPTRAMTLNSISFMPAATSATVNLRPVVYGDSTGAPGTLLSAGGTVTGMTSGTAAVLPLTTPQSLAAGTQYWLGFMCDVAVTTGITGLEAATTDRTATSTFASGAPGTAPAMTATSGTVIWGNVSGTGVNFYEAAQNPSQGSQSYLFDATVGHEDLYSYPALSAPPSAIYAVAVKGSLAKSDAGAKTASLRLKSSSSDSAGSGGTAIAPGTSSTWASSLYERDPNGNIAWTKTALDAAQAGVKVES